MSREYDLIVVGGGINGVAIARDAATRGMDVLLLEQNDFCSGASSKTSKLAHGGIRYLEQFQLPLVWECLKERDLLLENAPHLVKPLQFVYPVYKGDHRPLWMVKLGLYLYDLLKGSSLLPGHRNLSAPEILNLFPMIKTEGLCGGCLYFDALMQDERLVIENMRSAEKAGAVCRNYCEVTALVKDGEKVVGVRYKNRFDPADAGVARAKHVVNATGAWSNRILGMDPVPSIAGVRPTKGIHLVLPQMNRDHALILSAPQDNRIFFLIPWNGYSIVGTTDTPFEGDPGKLEVKPEEVHYLLDALSHYFPAAPLDENAVVATFAGLRPLVDFKLGRGNAGREHYIGASPSGLITVLGGKYTTHRKMAEETVDLVLGRVERRQRPSVTKDMPLYGGETLPSLERLNGSLSQEKLDHLIATYGSAVNEVLAIIHENPAEGQQLCPHHPHLLGEVTYAITKEHARHINDWFFRRTAIGYSACKGLDSIDAVSRKFAEMQHWDDATLADEARAYSSYCKCSSNLS